MAAGTGTRTLNWACGLFGTFLAAAVLLPVAFCAYLAWLFWMLDAPAVAVYSALTGLLLLSVPVVFLRAYDRWQTRKGLQ